MHIPRIYQTVTLQGGHTISLDKQASHHLKNVLRLKLKDSLIVFNGLGGEYHATLIDYNKAYIKEYIPIKNESPLLIHLGQSLCRNDKMDYIIQKSVELGVNQLTPIYTKRTEVKITEKKPQRWQNIIINACEQCGRNILPVMEKPKSMSQYIDAEKSVLKLILTPGQGVSLQELEASPSSVSLLIGPESGFDPEEVQKAIASGFQTIRLGPRILRTETAALAMISALQLKWGDF
ncbi:MAG: 16S rRNA (uracil(1498)-N(3))-methyltransferase [Gammaproteobacteria bacterium]